MANTDQELLDKIDAACTRFLKGDLSQDTPNVFTVRDRVMAGGMLRCLAREMGWPVAAVQGTAVIALTRDVDDSASANRPDQDPRSPVPGRSS